MMLRHFEIYLCFFLCQKLQRISKRSENFSIDCSLLPLTSCGVIHCPEEERERERDTKGETEQKSCCNPLLNFGYTRPLHRQTCVFTNHLTWLVSAFYILSFKCLVCPYTTRQGLWWQQKWDEMRVEGGENKSEQSSQEEIGKKSTLFMDYVTCRVDRSFLLDEPLPHTLHPLLTLFRSFCFCHLQTTTREQRL